MDVISIRTSAGHFGFTGRLSTREPVEPMFLILAGAFPTKTQHHELANWFPAHDVVVGCLPGMNGQPFSSANAAELTEGLGEAVERLSGGRPVLLCGSSASALVTMPLNASNIYRKVLVEPFLRTQDLWPFLTFSRRSMSASNNDSLNRWLWTLFGFGVDEVADRDYRDLVSALKVPTDVFVGGMPLMPPRSVERWPSLTSPEDRAIFAASPVVTMHEGASDVGHDVWIVPSATAQIAQIILAGLEEGARIQR